MDSHKTLICLAFTVVIADTIWLIMWSLAAFGVMQSSRKEGQEVKIGPAAYLLLLSLFWGCGVIVNIVHTTIAGTVAAWWFNANSKGATGAALKRSCTTSLGSICFGTLLVAILETFMSVS